MSVVSLLSFRIICKTIKHDYNMKLEYNSIGGFSFHLYYSEIMEIYWWKTFF